MRNNIGRALVCSAFLSLTFGAPAQPANDNFASRIVVFGTNIMVTGSNLGATREADEPSNGFFTNSVWWEWSAPAEGTLELSATSDRFTPAIVLYTMDSDSRLYWQDGAAGVPAVIRRVVYPGERFAIAAGGWAGESGPFQLSLRLLGEPPNSVFTNSIHMGSGPCRTNGWVFLSMAGTAWYSWTAEGDGPATFSVPEEGFVLSVYSGTSESNLELLSSSERRSPVSGIQASIEARAGATYYVKVARYWSSWANVFTLVASLNRPPLVALRELPGSSHYQEGLRRLRAEVFDGDGRVEKVEFYGTLLWGDGQDYMNLSTDTSWPFEYEWTNMPFVWDALVAVATDDLGARAMCPPLYITSSPYNDAFTNRLMLAGPSITVTSWFAGATLEAFEPVPPGVQGASVWFTWTAPFSGPVTVRAGFPDAGPNAGIEYTIGAFTGSDLASLTLVTNSPSPLVVGVSAGVTYQFAVYAYQNYLKLPFSITKSAPPNVELTSPAASTEWTAGSPVVITANATDDEGIDHVDFYLEANLIGSVTNPPYTLTHTFPQTEYSSTRSFAAVAFDNEGLSARSAAVPVVVVPQPPVNDAFTNAIQLAGSSFSVTGSLFYATTETNEPNASGSVWYTWTAPFSRRVTLRSGLSPAIASISVFTGTALNALTLVGRSFPDWSLDYETRLTFAATAGVEYRIALCGGPYYNSPVSLEMVPSAPPTITLVSPTNYPVCLSGTPVLFSADANDPEGAIQRVDFYADGALLGSVTGPPFQWRGNFTNLYGTAWHTAWVAVTDESGLSRTSGQAMFGVAAPAPANDSFSNRIALTGSFLSVTGTTASATWNTGEPGMGGDGTVWWSWRAPASGPTTIVLGADEYGAQLAVCTGSPGSGLTVITNCFGDALPGVVSFKALAGQEYELAVSYYRVYGGPVWMVIGQSAPPTVTITNPTNSSSVVEIISGDPIVLSAAPAASNGEVARVAFYNDYTGATVALLTNPPWSTTIILTNSSPWGDLLPIRARVTDSQGLIGYSEPVSFYLRARGPTNDLFENRLVLEGCSLVVTGSTAKATGDGYPTGYDPSIWWSWTAPVSGWLTLDVVLGWGGDLRVFTGSALTNLIEIASTNLNNYQYGRLAFPVTAGTAYAIEVSTPSFLSAGAAVLLNLHCGAPATVSMTTPADGSLFVVGFSILAGARVQTLDSSRPNVEFYLDSILVQTVTNPLSPAVIALPSPPLGFHYLQVRAVGEYGLVSESPQVTFSVIPPRPANDMFANRLPLHGFIASAEANTQYATRETGEPDPFPQLELGTLWFTWTAPATGRLHVQAANGCEQLSVWTGSSLSELRLVGTNEDWASQVVVPVSRGTTLQIACAGSLDPITLFLETDENALVSDSGMTSEGRFRLRFETLYQEPWLIEGSTDLEQWSPLATNSALRNVFEFVDEQSWLFPRRFYRVSSQAERGYEPKTSRSEVGAADR